MFAYFSKDLQFTKAENTCLSILQVYYTSLCHVYCTIKAILLKIITFKGWPWCKQVWGQLMTNITAIKRYKFWTFLLPKMSKYIFERVSNYFFQLSKALLFNPTASVRISSTSLCTAHIWRFVSGEFWQAEVWPS